MKVRVCEGCLLVIYFISIRKKVHLAIDKHYFFHCLQLHFIICPLKLETCFSGSRDEHCICILKIFVQACELHGINHRVGVKDLYKYLKL